MKLIMILILTFTRELIPGSKVGYKARKDIGGSDGIKYHNLFSELKSEIRQRNIEDKRPDKRKGETDQGSSCCIEDSTGAHNKSITSDSQNNYSNIGNSTFLDFQVF